MPIERLARSASSFAIIKPCEPSANARPGDGRRLFVGTKPLCHCGHAGHSAVIAFSASASAPAEWRWAAALLAGGVALTSHSTKASARAAANTVPEPFSNWALSIGEDLLAVWLTWFTTAHPILAIVLVALLVILCFYLLFKLF